MDAENKIIHGLWIGKHLSVIELLCIHSFISHGHEFHLWVYDTPETPLPVEIILEDATQIISPESIFTYKNKNQFGHGKGSYAGFSDVFRFKLLYEQGGWWVDMDVICLKPLNFEEEYAFRTHHDFPVVGNVMKCPKGCNLMLDCYCEAVEKVNAENTDWNLPIQILNDNIQKFGLDRYIKDFSNPDQWLYLRKLLLRNNEVPEHWHVIHLLNEEWRRNRIIKESLPSWSFVGNLLRKHQISTSYKHYQVAVNYFRIQFPEGTSNLIRIIRFIKGFVINFFWVTVRLVKKERKGD